MEHQESKNDTDQSKPLLDERGRFAKGNTPPAGFNKHPENRNPGGWRKEDTPRFKLEQMMKLSADELKKVAEDKSTPLFEQKLAVSIKNGQWREIKEMIQEVYGKPKESVDISNPDGSLTPVVRVIDERKDKS